MLEIDLENRRGNSGMMYPCRLLLFISFGKFLSDFVGQC